MSVMEAAKRAAGRPTYKALLAENERLRSAITWALGETPDDKGLGFGDEDRRPHEGPRYGRYWWRKTLRRMAGMGDLAYDKTKRTIVPRDLQQTAAPAYECETCRDDPIACAATPLRHCAKLERDAQ